MTSRFQATKKQHFKSMPACLFGQFLDTLPAILLLVALVVSCFLPSNGFIQSSHRPSLNISYPILVGIKALFRLIGYRPIEIVAKIQHFRHHDRLTLISNDWGSVHN